MKLACLGAHPLASILLDEMTRANVFSTLDLERLSKPTKGIPKLTVENSSLCTASTAASRSVRPLAPGSRVIPGEEALPLKHLGKLVSPCLQVLGVGKLR